MISPTATTYVTCAVEVFLATVLLHRENPAREEFTIQEIVNRAARENISGEMRSGVNVHASQHCVANRAPNPAKHRMLFATGKHTRRLLLPGDEIHPGRTGKIFPDANEIPAEYVLDLQWAKERYELGFSSSSNRAADADVRMHSLPGRSTLPTESGSNLDGPGKRPRHLEALLQARGIGAHLAGDIDPDEHIRELREGWE